MCVCVCVCVWGGGGGGGGGGALQLSLDVYSMSVRYWVFRSGGITSHIAEEYEYM